MCVWKQTLRIVQQRLSGIKQDERHVEARDERQFFERDTKDRLLGHRGLLGGRLGRLGWVRGRGQWSAGAHGLLLFLQLTHTPNPVGDICGILVKRFSLLLVHRIVHAEQSRAAVHHLRHKLELQHVQLSCALGHAPLVLGRLALCKVGTAVTEGSCVECGEREVGKWKGVSYLVTTETGAEDGTIVQHSRELLFLSKGR